MNPPDNSRLTRLLAELLDAPQDDAAALMKSALQTLVSSRLITGDRSEEPSFEEDEEEGGVLLALFTDLVELHFFDPGAPWALVAGEEAIRAVARGDWDGLVINPRGRRFTLSREDVLELFEIDAS